jgi:hypothetical protein
MTGKGKGYKRSWRTLLLKQYQLSFTILMVVVSALLMGGLGWWVNREATQVTRIGLNGLSDCRVQPQPPPEPERPHVKVDVDVGEMKMVEPGTEAPPEGDMPAPPEETPAPPPPPTIAPPPSDDRTTWPIDSACVDKQQTKRADLLAGQRHILYALILVGLLLVLGLAFYGIKMTHKVAGPLHKVGLYFAKMRDGKLDTVYNLRKGDQLVEFYEHFKHAHAGLRRMEEEDIARLREAIRTAEAADLASKSPELAALLDEMRASLERKEKSLV